MATLHQHQRPKKSLSGSPYIEVTLCSIDVANQLSNEVLGRSLDDAPPTRRFSGLLFCMVRRESERQTMDPADTTSPEGRRARHRMGFPTVKAHLERLIDSRMCSYTRKEDGALAQVLCDGEDTRQRPFLVGLLNIQKLENNQYNPKVAEFWTDDENGGRPSGPISAGETE